MLRRNSWVFIIVLVIFVLALAVVFPIEEGTLGKKGVQLGLDLQGGLHVVYQADLSAMEADERADALEGARAVLENRVNPLRGWTFDLSRPYTSPMDGNNPGNTSDPGRYYPADRNAYGWYDPVTSYPYGPSLATPMEARALDPYDFEVSSISGTACAFKIEIRASAAAT